MKFRAPIGARDVAQPQIHGGSIAVSASGIGYAGVGSAAPADTELAVIDPSADQVMLVDVVVSSNVSSLSGLQNFDGITGFAGQKLFLRGQTTTSQNGPYIMAGGAWTRAQDELDRRTLVRVNRGTNESGSTLRLATSSDPVIGTDGFTMTYAIMGEGTTGKVPRFTSAGKVTAGLISDDGSTIRVGTSATTGVVNIERNSVSAATLYVKNTATSGSGVGAYIEAANSGGYGVEAVGGASGAGGVYARASAGSGHALYAVATTGRSIYAHRNNSGGIHPVVEILQQHVSDSSRALLVSSFGSGNVVEIQPASGRGLLVTRSSTSATEAVVEFEQVNAGDVENTLFVSNAGTSSGAGAIRASTTGGGVTVFAGANTHSAFYGYRNSGSTTSPLAQLWDDHGSSTQTVLFVRGDGTGNLFELYNSGTERFITTSSGYVSINAASGGTALLVDSADTSGSIAVLHLRQHQSWGIGFYDVYSGGNAAHAFQHITRRGRGSIDSPADVQSGDQIGAYLFRPRANATFSNATGFLAYVDGSVSGTTCPTRLEIHVRATTTMAEAARFDSAGNFAIGTAATATARIQAQISSGTIHGLVVDQQGAADLVQFQDGGTTVWKIKDGGAVDQEVGEEKPYDSFSSTTTLGSAHWHVHMDTSGGARTFNLPAGSGAVERVYFIENTGGAALTLARNGSDTINGAGANITINSGEFYFVHATSTTNWRAIRIA